MQLTDLKQFLARQLNDHNESPSGVVQKTFFEWTENHVCQAIELGICYVYSLFPQEFSKTQTHVVSKPDCVIDFCQSCSKFINLVTVEIDGKKCIDLSRIDSETNSLTGLLDIGCTSGGESEVQSGYEWDLVDGSSCVVLFDRPVPAGAKFTYLCAPVPKAEDVLDGQFAQYKGLIADYALWWLFRTDSESRSNLDRARLHFEGVKFFVETKLLLEFSLQEDDYNFGRRKVDD